MRFQYKTVFMLLVFTFMGFSALLGFSENEDFGAKGAMDQSDMDLKTMLTYAIEDVQRMAKLLLPKTVQVEAGTGHLDHGGRPDIKMKKGGV